MSINPEKFTDKTNETLVAAKELAAEYKHVYMAPVHVAIVLFSSSDGLGKRICAKIGVEPQGVEGNLRRLLIRVPSQDPAPDDVQPNQALLKVLKTAIELQKKQGDSHLAVDHLLLALPKDSEIEQALKDSGLKADAFEKVVKEIRGSRKVESKGAEDTYDALNKYAIDLVSLAEAGKLDPVIGRDEEIRRVVRVLSRRTKNNPVLIGEPGVGKTAIVEGLAQRIIRGDVPKNLECKLFSLDMGALIAGAKYRGEFEERLKAVLKEVKESATPIIMFIDEIHLVLGAGKTDGAMDAANLLKPMLARGELRCIGATTLDEYKRYVEKDAAFERRFQQVYVGEPSVPDTISILRGLKEKYENHHGVRISDGALVVAAQLASRYITNRFLPDKAIDLVDEACASVRVQLDSQPEVIDQLERRQLTLEVEKAALEKETDDGSKHRLEKVRKELTKIREEMEPLKLQYETEKGRLDELRAATQKLEKLKQKAEEANRRRQVDVAADLLHGAIPELQKLIDTLTKEKLEHDQKRLLTEQVNAEQIAEVVARWTGIPVTKLSQTEKEKVLHLGDILHRKVVGQDEAVDAVAEAVLRSRAGMSRQNQPTGSFLFLGPTGVGKTELAKALAAELFDDEKHIVRIDMSEYMEQHAVARLIGAPPGYVGYDEGGQLTEAVRRRPYSVVLFDEVEKAHTSVFNVLLQVLDDGRLTDGKGRTVDFSNTVIIMTSNLGAEYLLQSLEAQIKANPNLTTISHAPGVRDQVMNKVKKHFRPEFLNRLDDIVIFNPLSRGDLSQIVMIQMNGLAKRLEGKNLQVELSQAAITQVLGVAYDPLYGARPLRRYLEKHIMTEIARLIISGQVTEHQKILVDTVKTHNGDNKLTFSILSLPKEEDMEVENANKKKNKKKHLTGNSNSNSNSNSTTRTGKGGYKRKREKEGKEK